MLINTLAITGFLLPIIALVLVALLWWPTRRTGLLASAPWIVAFLVSQSLISRLAHPISAAYRTAVLAPNANYQIVATVSALLLLFSATSYFVIALMLSANAAFLVHSRVSSAFVTGFSSVHRYQIPIGLLLLASLVFPWVLLYTVTPHLSK